MNSLLAAFGTVVFVVVDK